MSVILLPSHRPAPGPGPRADFALLAERFGGGARVLYPPARTGVAGRAEAQLATDVRQALAAARDRDATLFVSLSERVGLPLALLLRRRGMDRPPHVLVAHRLTSRAKRALHRRTGVFGDFARVVTLCHAQARAAVDEFGVTEGRVVRLWDAVDTKWWHLARETLPGPPLVLSVGRERRDFGTLLAALSALPEVHGVLVAGSPWSRGAGGELPAPLPPNVEAVADLSAPDLRALCARASVAVVAVRAGCDYAAGSNALLEAMAAGLPLVATRTPGLAEYLGDETACRAVCAGSAPVLAEAIRAALADAGESERLGARAAVVARAAFSLERYADDLERVVRGAMAER